MVSGAATSVIGQVPKVESDGIYDDSNIWPALEPTRPNEKAKYLAEKACWDEVLSYETDGVKTKMSTILPYFISGPPLFKDQTNSSLQAI